MASTDIVPIAASQKPKSFPENGNYNMPVSSTGVPMPQDAVDNDTPGSPAAMEDTFINNQAAYAASRGRYARHSVGAPAVGPRGSMIPTIGPISNT
jgi:hypothetical protein